MRPVISLGNMPLANSLLQEADLERPEASFPLDVAFCESCKLAQLAYSVPPEQLFDHYLYFSSFSDTALKNAADLAARLTRDLSLGSRSLVVEVASNDGYLLQQYQKLGVPVLGIEPARNVAEVAVERGIPTLVRYFGRAVGEELRSDGHAADVIHANNVLGHVPKLDDFVAGLAALLKPSGLLVIEVPHVMELVDRLEFDTIYHEHVSYFSVFTLQSALARHGLELVDVERLEIHGGSIRAMARHAGPAYLRVRQLLELERSRSVNDFDFYRSFADRVERFRAELRSLLGELRAAGGRIAAYGASAKGSTLLNYCRIGKESIDFMVDRSTIKQGYYTPGTHFLIEPPERLLREMPPYTLLLTWNFAEEILAQQKEYRLRGGRFILPLPRPAVL